MMMSSFYCCMYIVCFLFYFFFFKQKTAYEMRISDWSSDVCSSDLLAEEDESYANEFKVYDLQGRFTGRTFGGDFLQAQAEGIALKACADGSGWWLTTEQGKGRTVFHLFDRSTLAHVEIGRASCRERVGRCV